MTNPLYKIDQLPATSAAAIREFNDRYIAALAAAPASGWVDRLGALIPTTSPMVTFPLTQLRSKFQRTMGESRFKTLGEKSFDIKTEEFDDGYQAKLYDLLRQTFAYRRWQQAPAALLAAEERFRHQQIAAALRVGESTPFLDTGENFFDTAIPANLFDSSSGSFSNHQTNATDVVSIANIEAEVQAMQEVKDENGDLLGVMPDTILCGVKKAEPLKNLLKQAMIADPGGVAAGVTNPYMNGFNVELLHEWPTSGGEENDWFLVDSKLIGEIPPWIVLRETVPQSLGLRIFDESTDFFRDTGNLKISAHIWYGNSLALPHAIRKVKGA